MKVLFLILLVFQVIYDNWIPQGLHWHIIYDAFWFTWVAVLSYKLATKNDHQFNYIFSIIMIITALCQFLQWNQKEVSQAPPGVTWFSIFVTAILLLMLLKNTVWEKLKKTGNSFS